MPSEASPTPVGERRGRSGADAFGAIHRVTRLPFLAVLAGAVAVALPVLLLVRRSSAPALVRWYFERAGGGVVKIGQLLATRYDVLPPAYCEELGRLLDDLRPVPAARIRDTIRRSLGAPVHELFASFDDVPMATASLAQVHAATLWTGEPVVVKVLKPGIRRLVSTDATFLRAVARLLRAVPRFADLDVVNVAADLRRQALAELDFEREAAALAFFHQAMAKDELPHHTPVPYRDLCRGDVLTMERIDGVTVRELISALHDGDTARLDAWAERGITPRLVARLVFRSVLEQSMRHRSFNGDPHPSNLIVSDGGQLNWVDFGLVGWLDERQWSLQLRIRQAFLRDRVHAAYQLFVESVGPFPDRDLRAFESEMKEAIRDYVLAARDPDAPLSRRSTGAFLMRTLGALRRNGLPVSTSTMPLYRAILIADIVMLRLDPRVDWLSELEEFLVDFVAEQTEAEIQATIDDPGVYASLLAAPFTMLAGVDWLDRQLLSGRRRAPEDRSTTDEAVVGLAGVVRLAARVALVAAVVVGTGVAEPPGTGVFAGSLEWAASHTLAAVTGLAVLNVWLGRWMRRLQR